MIRVIGSSDQPAKKTHICDSCLGEIRRGVIYRRMRCVDDGDAWTWKAHIACHRAGEILRNEDIRGDDDSLVNACDMEGEDREIIYAIEPETFRAVWPDRPAPGKPKPVQ